MSLVTRCASCGTVFRVVQDQLKVSEGWVRCGRCDAVFNALEGLFDLGRDDALEAAAPPPPVPPVPPVPPLRPLVTAPPVSANTTTTSSATSHAAVDIRTDIDPSDPEDDDVRALWTDGPVSALDELLADPIDGHIFRERARADEVGERDRLEFSDARFDSDLFAESPSPAEADTLLAPPSDAAALPLESTVRPDFVRRADRRAVWHSLPARLALAGACLLAALALVLQAGNHFRDTLAAQSPSLRPALVAWCGVVGCALQPPRHIEDVVVDNSALARAANGDAFVLSISLRNKGSVTLAMPSVDLNLTDVYGKQIARRALSPRDFHAADALQPGAEAALQLILAAGGARIAGYNIEIFYP